MTAKVISLCDYRKSRDAEKRSKNARGLDFPNEDFGILGLNLSLDNPKMHHQNFPFAFSFRRPIEGIKINLPPKEEE